LLALLGAHHLFHVSKVRVKLDLQEMERGMHWINLAQDTDSWQALIDVVMKFWVA
jgi:hypothetical protein